MGTKLPSGGHTVAQIQMNYSYSYILGPRYCPIGATSGSDHGQFSPNMWTPPCWRGSDDLRKGFLACRKNVRQAFSTLPGHFKPLSDIFPSWLMAKISGPCFPYQTKCPVWSQPPAGHEQKSAGHVRHISWSLRNYENRSHFWRWQFSYSLEFVYKRHRERGSKEYKFIRDRPGKVCIARRGAKYICM